MKEFTTRERMRLLTGILFMGTLITLYILLSSSFERFSLYRIFFPIFWGMFTVTFIVSELLRKCFPEKNYSIKYSREKDFSCANTVTAVVIILCYCLIDAFQVSVSTMENILSIFTYVIILLMVAYLVLATKVPGNAPVMWTENTPYDYKVHPNVQSSVPNPDFFEVDDTNEDPEDTDPTIEDLEDKEKPDTNTEGDK